MADYVTWPREALVPRRPSYNLRARSQRAATTLAGTTQVVASNAAFWLIGFNQLPITSTADIKTLWAFAGLLQGGVGKVLLPVHDPVSRLPVGVTANASVPHSDKTYFTDGAGYLSSVNDVKLGGAILAGATSATVIIGASGDLGPGNHFSIGTRLYRVKSLADNGNGTHALTFTPPAREAASLGAVLEFDRPVVLARLADDSQLDMDLDLARYGNLDIAFVEAF